MILNSVLYKMQEESSTVVGTEKIKTLCEEFKQQIKKVKLVKETDQSISDPPVTELQEDESEKEQATGMFCCLIEYG